jgi:hypothetical protein
MASKVDELHERVQGTLVRSGSRRSFVLQVNSLIKDPKSCFRNPIIINCLRTKEEMQHTCRGTLVLKDAKIEVGLCDQYDLCLICTETGNNFIVFAGGARKEGQYFELRAHSERERQEWITVLELAKVSSPSSTFKFRLVYLS